MDEAINQITTEAREAKDARWKELAEQITTETDSRRLTQLVSELCQELERKKLSV